MKKRNKGLLIFLVLIFIYMGSFYFYENQVKLWIAEEAFLGFQKENGLTLDTSEYDFLNNKKMGWVDIIKKDDKDEYYIYNEATEEISMLGGNYPPYHYPKARYLKKWFEPNKKAP